MARLRWRPKLLSLTGRERAVPAHTAPALRTCQLAFLLARAGGAPEALRLQLESAPTWLLPARSRILAPTRQR